MNSEFPLLSPWDNQPGELHCFRTDRRDLVGGASPLEDAQEPADVAVQLIQEVPAPPGGEDAVGAQAHVGNETFTQGFLTNSDEMWADGVRDLSIVPPIEVTQGNHALPVKPLLETFYMMFKNPLDLVTQVHTSSTTSLCLEGRHGDNAIPRHVALWEECLLWSAWWRRACWSAWCS